MLFLSKLPSRLQKSVQTLTALCLLIGLGACGGGDNTQLVEGGIGGTGISVGSITGFGSIYQNGIRYDVSQANFYRDGQPVNDETAFRIGEVVTITGNRSANTLAQGQAERVEFNTTLQGVITQAPSSNTLNILQQAVRINGRTVLHGIQQLNELQTGQVVTLSGERDANGTINATSLSLQANQFLSGSSTHIVQGFVSDHHNVQQTFQLGKLTIDYSRVSLAQALNKGDYVRVYSQRPLRQNTLLADRIRLQQATPNFATGTEVELEGFITRFIRSDRFNVSGQAVQTNSHTEYEHGTAADLQLNAAVEVEGKIDANGVLQAEEIAIRQGDNAEELELEGFIEAIDDDKQTLHVLGNTLFVDGDSILLDERHDNERSIKLSELRSQDYVEVDIAQLNDGTLLVLKLERKNENGQEAESEIEGTVESIDKVAQTLKVLNIAITTDVNTQFFHKDDTVLTRQDFFATVTPQNRVEVEGHPLDSDNTWLLADTITLKTEDD